MPDQGSMGAQRIGFLAGTGGRKLAYAVAGAGPPLVCAALWVSHVERDRELGRVEVRVALEALGGRPRRLDGALVIGTACSYDPERSVAWLL